MSHRTSLAGVDELKYSFEQANISTQDSTSFRSMNSCNIEFDLSLFVDARVGEISDTDDSDNSDAVRIIVICIT